MLRLVRFKMRKLLEKESNRQVNLSYLKVLLQVYLFSFITCYILINWTFTDQYNVKNRPEIALEPVISSSWQFSFSKFRTSAIRKHGGAIFIITIFYVQSFKNKFQRIKCSHISQDKRS